MTKRDKRTKDCPTCGNPFHPIICRFDTQKFCCWKCIRRTEEFKKKVSLGMRGVNTWAKGKKLPDRSGENSWFWKGGVSIINRTKRQTAESTVEYREFRRKVFKRDNYTCQVCGDRTMAGHKIKIQIDHIKPFRFFPDLHMSEENVRTICLPCHYKTETYGAKVYRLSPIPTIKSDRWRGAC